MIYGYQQLKINDFIAFKLIFFFQKKDKKDNLLVLLVLLMFHIFWLI